MNPNSRELFGPTTGFHIAIEMIGHRFIIEFHVCPGSPLANQLNVFDQQQVIDGCNTESTYFRITTVTQKQQFGPC